MESMDANVLLLCRPAEEDRLKDVHATTEDRSRRTARGQRREHRGAETGGAGGAVATSDDARSDGSAAAAAKVGDAGHEGRGSEPGNLVAFVENKVHHGHLDGIVLCACAAAHLARNEVYRNSSHGIVAASGAWPTIVNNTIFSNLCNGILLVNEAGGIVQGNTIYKQGKNGIVAKWCSTTSLVANEIYDNRRCGVRVSHDLLIDVLQNEIRKNAVCGVWIKDCAPTIEQCTIMANGEAGVRWTGGAAGQLINNDIYDNVLCALSIEEGCGPDFNAKSTASQARALKASDAAEEALDAAEASRVADLQRPGSAAAARAAAAAADALAAGLADGAGHDGVASKAEADESTDEEAGGFSGSNTVYGGMLSFPRFHIKTMFRAAAGDRYDPGKENLATLGFATMLESFGLAPLQIARREKAKADAAMRLATEKGAVEGAASKREGATKERARR